MDITTSTKIAVIVGRNYSYIIIFYVKFYSKSSRKRKQKVVCEVFFNFDITIVCRRFIMCVKAADCIG